jgi:phytoene desaturase
MIIHCPKIDLKTTQSNSPEQSGNHFFRLFSISFLKLSPKGALMKKIIVIGSGVAGLSAAACLAREGFDVTVFEKNSSAGGRARKFESHGFVFDMGPSWYWMPDVFENFFQLFGKKVSDYYDLKRLDPSYRVYYGVSDYLDMPAGVPAICDLFETMESQSSGRLLQFLDEGEIKYRLAMDRIVHKPGLSICELADSRILGNLLKLHIFQSLSRYIARFFKNPRLINLLEFPVLFLGAAPANTPALYSLMNYADMALGTWYPLGGMHRIIEGMLAVCESQGVKFQFNAPVKRIAVSGSLAGGVWSDTNFHPADYIVAGADYRHVEKDLLPPESRQYSNRYWDSRQMAPSCLIFYLGINKRIKSLRHHSLFFDTDIGLHLSETYNKHPHWPTEPQFYVCCPSRTDPTVAPPGCENLFLLIPVASGLEDHPDIREKYFVKTMERLEKLTGESLLPYIIFKRSYAHDDFTEDYNAFKGNAYGLANTLLQTANFKPGVVNRKVSNLFFTGHLTVPGPGLPPSIISGQVTAKTLIKRHRKIHDKTSS